MATAPSLSGRAESRVPPHDLDAENSVLGAILLDPAAITRVLEILRAEDFYRENNSQIYRAAVNLFQAGEPIDNVTLAAALERLGVLERVGGRAQLALLAEGVPTAANVEYYSRIVRSKAVKRKLIQAGGEVAAVGFDDSIDADDALNQAEKAVFDVAEERVSSAMSRLYELLRPAMDRIDAQMSSGNAVVGVPSGFYDLDNLTSGFKPSDLIVVAGRPAMGKCLTAQTLIDDPTSGARLTIEEFVRRRLPLVWSLSTAGWVRPTAVSDWVDSGVQEAFRVRTWTGRTVEVTGHHPFLTVDGWQPLHDLRIGDRIAVPRRVPCFGSESVAADQVRALARDLAEGGPAARFPSACWRWNREHLLELLRSLFSHAGSELIVGSQGLAEDLQHALIRFGIVATIWGSRTGRWSIRVADAVPIDSLGAISAPAPLAVASRVDVEPLEVGTDVGLAAYAYVLDDAQALRLSSPDLHWDEIVSVQAIGKHQVYDLTVPDGASFIAQDVVVHNTSFMTNLTLHAAVERQVPVAVFSLEMSKEQLVERLLCQQARIDSQRMHRGMLSEAEYERLVMAIGPLENAPIFIDDSPVLDELSLLLKARQAKVRENIGMIVLDYLQLMQGRGRSDDFNRVQEVSSISRSLKALARELKLPVIAISQLSRAPEARPNKRPMLSDLRECVVGSTRLVDADSGRLVPIQDLRPGSRILSLDSDQKIRPFSVADVWSTGVKDVFTLETQTKRRVTCTANHPFLTPSGWRRLDELTPSDTIATALRLPSYGQEIPERADLCRLLGYLVGDGSYTKHRGVEFISADPECLEDVRAIVCSRFPTVAIVEQRPRPGIGAREIHLSATYANGYGKPYGNPLREWLRAIGIFGQRDRDKRVPAFVFEAGAVGAREFLAGYLASDGCVTRSPSERWSVRFDTVSRGLAEDVCALLLRLGIVGTISRPQWSTASAQPVFRVTVAVSHQAVLAPLMPVRGRKGRQLGELINSPSRNLTNPGLFGLPRPLSTYVAERSRELAVASGGYGPGRSAAEHGPLWRDQGKRMRREIAWEWSTQLEDQTLARWADSDLLWESIQSIQPVGQREVFDISVPGAHNFVGNGIVAHNSGSIEQDSDIVIFLYRDEYYNPNTDQQGIAEVHVAKHRNGPTDTIKLRFRKDQTLFYNLESRRPEPEPV